MAVHRVYSLLAAGAASLLLLGGCATPPPAVSHDGLHLVPQKSLDQMYIKPEVSLSQYTAIRLEPCTVAFRADWLRNQNMSRTVGRDRITEEDMQVISDRLARSCDEHFLEALESEPAYKIVGEDASGETVLEVRPSIIDLDVTAPDTNDVGITRTYTTSSGEMTLFLEAYDSASGEIIARVVDEKEDFDDMQLEWTNRATNMADANRYLRSWTKSLRESLDAARAQ
jgi:hypothetical protein